MHEKRQDDGTRDTRKPDIHSVQVNGRCDRHIASVRVDESGVVRQGRDDADRRSLTRIRMFKLLEPAGITSES